MMATVTTSAVWFLALLAAVALSARAPVRPLPLIILAATFVLAMAAASYLAPRSNWIGLVVGVIACWRLIRGGSTRTDMVLAGLCAGLAGALYVGGGIAIPLAAATAGLTLAAGLLLANVRNAIPGVREAALAATALFAPVLGLAPDVAAGWVSGQSLTIAAAATQAPNEAIPVWAIILVVLALVAGFARGLWVRR